MFDPNLNLIDGLSFDQQGADISYGRAIDGDGNWQFFTAPTPGESNIESCVAGDVNCDNAIDILDIVMLVGYILGNNDLDDVGHSVADFNQDGLINILDVVQLVSEILND